MPERLRRTINVIIADDDEDDCRLLENAIGQSLPEVHSRFVADGQALLDYLYTCERRGASPCPDLILLDLNMPRMDGREALIAIKGHERLKTIPVIILSTSNEPDDIDFSYKHGANSFLKKPFTYDELVRLMSALGAYWFNAAEMPNIAPHRRIITPKLKTTMLVVDDSSFARKLLIRILKLAGHNVLEADDGKAAIELYGTNKPEVVLLDLALPDFSGTEVLRRLQQIDPEVKVIMTTSVIGEDERDRLMAEGIKGILFKPLASEATLKSVGSALQEPILADKSKLTGTDE